MRWVLQHTLGLPCQLVVDLELVRPELQKWVREVMSSQQKANVVPPTVAVV